MGEPEPRYTAHLMPHNPAHIRPADTYCGTHMEDWQVACIYGGTPPPVDQTTVCPTCVDRWIEDPGKGYRPD